MKNNLVTSSHVKAVTGSGCQLALAPASTAQHISTCLHFYTMRCDLIYNIQERQDTKVEALSTVVYNNTTWWPLTRVDRFDEQQKLTTWSEWIQQQVPLSPALWCASCPVDKELPPWSRVDTWMATLGRVTGPRETWKPCSFPKWTSIRELREKEYFGWKYLFKT